MEKQKHRYRELGELLSNLGFNVAANAKSLAAVKAENVGVIVIVRCEEEVCEVSCTPSVAPTGRVPARYDALRAAVEATLKVVEEHRRAFGTLLSLVATMEPDFEVLRMLRQVEAYTPRVKLTLAYDPERKAYQITLRAQVELWLPTERPDDMEHIITIARKLDEVLSKLPLVLSEAA